MKSKGKPKGNLKGNFKGKSSPKKKLCSKCGCKQSEIIYGYELNLRGNYSLVEVRHLKEILRRIVREELDKRDRVTVQELLKTCHTTEGKPFWQTGDI